jgi:cell division protein ZipA
MPDGFFLSPSSESDRRAFSVLPDHGSEDASHLLHRWEDGPRAYTGDDDDDRDYGPKPAVDWVIDLAPTRAALKQQEVEPLLRGLSKQMPCSATGYGKLTDTGRWTYVICGHSAGPPAYSELKVGIKLQPLCEQEQLAQCLQVIRHLADSTRLFKVVEGESPASAAVRSEVLSQLVTDYRKEATIVLEATTSETFDGRTIWDVMLSLGLRWGDMDLFHWENQGDRGDQAHFSVWTSTAPGYFLPEQIRAGRVQTRDLIFGFSIPRSRDPEIILESMLAAADYARSRLGGNLKDAEGRALSVARLRETVQLVKRRLIAAGFPPGEHRTLYLF